MAKRRPRVYLYAVEVKRELKHTPLQHTSNHLVVSSSKDHVRQVLENRWNVLSVISIDPIPIPSSFNRDRAIAFARRIADELGSFTTSL